VHACTVGLKDRCGPMSYTCCRRVLDYLAWTCTDQGPLVSIEPSGDREVGGIRAAIVSPA
jgi:hypothetical protein